MFGVLCDCCVHELLVLLLRYVFYGLFVLCSVVCVMCDDFVTRAGCFWGGPLCDMC